MSSTAHPIVPSDAPRGALVARLISAFSGTVGVGAKIVLLSASNGLAIWAIFVLITRHHWVAVAVLIVATGLIDAVFLIRRSGATPAKFLVPGTVLLVSLQIVPIIYTVRIAFTNYSTGHIATKAAAIKQIELTSLQPPPNGKSYTMAVARDAGGKLVLILQDDTTHQDYVGTQTGLTALSAGTVQGGGGQITAAKGYTLLHGLALFNADKELQTTVPFFFVVSMGALQSIPEELTEAARVDGGGPLQIFRRVTLPLLLVAVAPLMISSFALNFNNFNNIYLLTGGGPFSGSSAVAGSTDILISYTYKIAIATGKETTMASRAR